jgi:hypothetical protein
MPQNARKTTSRKTGNPNVGRASGLISRPDRTILVDSIPPAMNAMRSSTDTLPKSRRKRRQKPWKGDFEGHSVRRRQWIRELEIPLEDGKQPPKIVSVAMLESDDKGDAQEDGGEESELEEFVAVFQKPKKAKKRAASRGGK